MQSNAARCPVSARSVPGQCPVQCPVGARSKKHTQIKKHRKYIKKESKVINIFLFVCRYLQTVVFSHRAPTGHCTGHRPGTDRAPTGHRPSHAVSTWNSIWNLFPCRCLRVLLAAVPAASTATPNLGCTERRRVNKIVATMAMSHAVPRWFTKTCCHHVRMCNILARGVKQKVGM